MSKPTGDAVYAAQLLYYLRRIQEQWNADAERIRNRSEEVKCQCHRRTYGLDGHVQILIGELVRLATEQLDDEAKVAERVRAWGELQRENRELHSRIKSLRGAAQFLLDTADKLEAT